MKTPSSLEHDNKNATVQVNVIISKELDSRLRIAAANLSQSRAAYIRELIESGVGYKQLKTKAPPKPSASPKLKGLLNRKPAWTKQPEPKSENKNFVTMRAWLNKHPEEEQDLIEQQRVWAQKLDHIRIPEDLNKVTEFYYPVFEHFMVENHPEITSEILGGGK